MKTFYKFLRNVFSMTLALIIILGNLLTDGIAIAVDEPPSYDENSDDSMVVEVEPIDEESGKDDTENIQKAINTENGEKQLTVKLKSGTYYISKSLDISKSNIKLVGEENTVIKWIGDFSGKKYSNVIMCYTSKAGEKHKGGNICNVSIENLSIDVGDTSGTESGKPKYGSSNGYGRGIAFVQQKKDSNGNFYEMKNISVKNCKIENAYSFGILVVGGKKLKDEYNSKFSNTDEIVKKLMDDESYDKSKNYDERKYCDYSNIKNVDISNCYVNRSRIGIRVNGGEEVKITKNTVQNSSLESITMQGKNIECCENSTLGYHAGCGSIAFDKCENIKITNNYIDDVDATNTEMYRIGICQNSAAGPSYNCEISNNYIIGASRGIWIKDHRYDGSNQAGVTSKIGSKPGAGFVIRDNEIKESELTDIRIDEILEKKLDLDNDECITEDGEEIGLSYVINSYGNTINNESNKSIGHYITNDDNKNLWILNEKYEKNGKDGKTTTVTIESNKELQDLEHWTLSEDKLKLSTKYHSSDKVYEGTTVSDQVEVKDVDENKYLLNLSSEKYLGNMEDGYLPIIGSTNNGKTLRMGYTDFNINEKGEYNLNGESKRYYLTDESKDNCEGDNVYLVLNNIEENDKININLNTSYLKQKENDNKGQGYFKLVLSKNKKDNFEILKDEYKYPYNIPFSRDVFICSTEKLGDKYTVTIRFNRYFISRYSNELNVYCSITNNDKKEEMFENSKEEDVSTWEKLRFTDVSIIDKQSDIIQDLIENKAEIEAEEAKESDVGEKVIDLMIFMGQSNMVGFGDISSDSEQKIEAVKDKNGNSINKEFKLYEDTEEEKTKSPRLLDLQEPFGTYQNYKQDGSKSQSTGSMVTAITNAYYKETGVPVVAVSSSVGGKSVYSWWNEEEGKNIGLKDAKEKYEAAVKYLSENGYTIRNKYMIWCQGESDSGTQSIIPKTTTTHYDTYLAQGQSYVDRLNAIINSMENITINVDDREEKIGIDKAFLVRIGNRSGSYGTFNDIQDIQTKMCKTQDNVVLASTAFKAVSLCKDTVWNSDEERYEYKYLIRDDLLHYHQEGYNLVGYDAGKNIAYYTNTGREPELVDYSVNKSTNEVEATKYKGLDKQHIISVNLDKKELSLAKGKTEALVAKLNPEENDEDKTITWSSSDDTVATVDTEGNVTAVKVGTATIKATASNGKYATCQVSVTNNLVQIEISKLPQKLTYIKGEDLDLSGLELTLNYEDGITTKTITAPNDEITVDGYNKEEVGEQNITVTYEGKTATFKVVVKERTYFDVKDYTLKEKYILNIKPGTKLSDFMKHIDTNMKYEILDRDGEEIDDQSLIGTGSKLKLQDGDIYTLVTDGDINGDGIIDISDLGIVAAYVVENAKLENEYFLAGDLNDDDVIDISDLSIIANLITK